MATFLFCLPRFHTNAVPWMRILQAAGHRPAVDVVERGATENYQLVAPALQPPGRLSRLLGRVVRDSGPNGRYVFPGLRTYWRHMAAVDPDVVIVRGVTRWFCRLAAACALMQGRRLVIYDQEDVAPRRWSSTWIRRAAFALVGIRHVTARVDAQADQHALGHALSLPFGCPMEASQAATLSGRDLHWPPRLLMVAKYRGRKGHAVLLEALAALKHMPFSITFCGEESGEKDAAFCARLRAKAEDLGIAERLHFRNNVPHAEMSAVYSSHDLFILPSQQEPAAVSPIEAAWSGCAVLLSRDSGTRGYFPTGSDYDFTASDADDIARAIARMIADPSTLLRARDKCISHLQGVGGESRILAGLVGLAPDSSRARQCMAAKSSSETHRL